MTQQASLFGINTYSYTLDQSAIDCIIHLAEQGYRGVELMVYPGHMWAPDLDAAARRAIRDAAERRGMRIMSVNMPNIDINIAAATREMRDYSLATLANAIRLAGDLGAPSVIIGPGKANPLFPPPIEELKGHLKRGLDALAPIAASAGTRLLAENMPFSFLPGAQALGGFLDEYGNDDIGVVYDIANGHFIGEDPRHGLRTLSRRLKLVHASDTGRDIYKHDAVGLGDVPFAETAPVLEELGYTEMLVLEVVSRNPDADIRDSVARLAALGYGASRSQEGRRR